MHLDVRIPIGLLFIVFGAILSVCGVVAGTGNPAQQLFGVHIDLSWGLVQLAFGAVMLWLAQRGKKRAAAEQK